MQLSRIKSVIAIPLLSAVVLIAGCTQKKSEAELQAETEPFLNTTLPAILGDWDFAKWKESTPRAWRSRNEPPFDFVGKVTVHTPGQYSSRMERLQGPSEEYYPRTGATQEEKFKAAAEQLGPLERIEKLQMGQKMIQDGYVVDSLITAKFKNQRSYIYCIVAYVRATSDGFQIAEFIPWKLKISSMYITPVPQVMERHLNRQIYKKPSTFHDTKLSALNE